MTRGDASGPRPGLQGFRSARANGTVGSARCCARELAKRSAPARRGGQPERGRCLGRRAAAASDPVHSWVRAQNGRLSSGRTSLIQDG